MVNSPFSFNRAMREQLQHEISFEISRQWEGLAGDKHKLGKAPTFLDKIKRHKKSITKWLRKA